MTVPQLPSRRVDLLRLSCIIVTVLAVALAAWGGSQFVAAAMTDREIAAQRRQRAEVRRLADEALKMQRDQAAIIKGVQRRPATWSWSEQLPVMIGQLGGIAQRAGARLDTLQPLPPAAKQGITRFPLRLTLHARMPALVAILNEVKQASPVLAVDALVIRAGETPGDPLVVDLTVSAYVMSGGAQ